ncbi:Gfo/Idh/MocA family oxidoreductase [Actinoplanes bogorensis]|uniref:Gfo/Idh/MocA family oxidoreductase n=1 Tax=Paractinoplanes bogorensis TaxID=1610840 RepID=A0ABS5YR27_9ACTN|nr:Gfo/Idh/MocA family oxidoreductase [Actinoplanes bogorensis]MBU2665906.1 Gfo/Idh/MocA family oxidoreductase [Actinoplanes bogorensis]
MRTAIIGFGTAGEGRLHAYRTVTGGRVVAVLDPSPQRRERARQIDPTVATYAGLPELLAAESVDAVDICTPPLYHVEVERAALTAGLHVICEKPVAVHTDEALDLVALAGQRGRLLYPAHNYGFSPMMRVLTGAVADGRIGRPMRASFRIARDSHARGVPGWQPDWRRDVSVARGGIMLDHGTHCAYMATRLFGEAPRTVSCVAQWADGDASGGMDVAARISLEFTTGECEIDLSWVSGTRSNRYLVTGPDGTADVHDGVAEVRSAGRVERTDLTPPTRDQTHQEWFGGMFADFAGLVAAGTGWDRPMREVVTTTALIEAAYRSAALGGEPVVPAGRATAEAR